MAPLTLNTLSALSVAAALLACGSARAATISFASDDDSSAFTLIGTPGSGGSFTITNGRDPAPTPLTLRIDDDNSVLPTVSLPVGLRVNLTAAYANSQPVGGAFTHVYTVSGQYSFVDPNTSTELMRVTIAPGSSNMTVLGSASDWGSAGSIFGSDAAFGGPGGVDWSTHAALAAYATSLSIDLAPYGLTSPGYVNEDFGFTMTLLGSGPGPVSIDPTTRLPLANWGSEASHSSHATPVPAPMSAAAMGLAALAAVRRRRR